MFFIGKKGDDDGREHSVQQLCYAGYFSTGQINGKGGGLQHGIFNIPGGKFLGFGLLFYRIDKINNFGKKSDKGQEKQAQAHIEQGMGIGKLSCSTGIKFASQSPYEIGKLGYPENKQDDPGKFKHDMGNGYPLGLPCGPDSCQGCGNTGADVGPEDNRDAAFKSNKSLLGQDNEYTGCGTAALDQGGKGCPNKNPHNRRFHIFHEVNECGISPQGFHDIAH